MNEFLANYFQWWIFCLIRIIFHGINIVTALALAERVASVPTPKSPGSVCNNRCRKWLATPTMSDEQKRIKIYFHFKWLITYFLCKILSWKRTNEHFRFLFIRLREMKNQHLLQFTGFKFLSIIFCCFFFVLFFGKFCVPLSTAIFKMRTQCAPYFDK